MQQTEDRTATPHAREDFRLDGWLVQPALNRVTAAGGSAVQVQPKIMGVLVRLAERPGEVVTKEQLFQTVWAGTHVTEHVLSRSISELRKIFADSAQRPRVIETIPKSGYRLIAPVTREAEKQVGNPEVEAATPSDTSSQIAPEPAGGPRRGPRAARLWLGVAALSTTTLLLALVLYLLFFVRHIGPWHPHHL